MDEQEQGAVMGCGVKNGLVCGGVSLGRTWWGWVGSGACYAGQGDVGQGRAGLGEVEA